MIAAYFDVDGTLVKDNTQYALAKVLLKEGHISASEVREVFFNVVLYKLNLASMRRRLSLYKLFSKISVTQLNEAAKIASESIRINNIFIDIVKSHKQKGHKTVILSSSLKVLCQQIAERFQIEEVYATELQSENGLHDGLTKNEVLEGRKKKDFIIKHAASRSFDLKECYCYGDHKSDLQMLMSVGKPVVVNPGMILRAVALRKKWGILSTD